MRDRDRERQRQRQRDRDKERYRERQRQRETKRDRDRERDRDRQRQRQTETHRESTSKQENDRHFLRFRPPSWRLNTTEPKRISDYTTPILATTIPNLMLIDCLRSWVKLLNKGFFSNN